MQPHDGHGSSKDRLVQGRFGMRPAVIYDGLIGEPVPLEHIELVLAIRRVERERRSERADLRGDELA